jgi:putative inorganic carbon (HCO3(-)) transporter
MMLPDVSRLPQPLGLRGSGTVIAAGFALAGAVSGVLVVQRSSLAVLVVGGLAVTYLVASNAGRLPALLVLTMFIESIEVAPELRIGRAAGVLALVVVLYVLFSRGRAGLRPNALIFAILALGAWVLLSAGWATDAALAYETLFRFLLAVSYALAFAVLVRTRMQVAGILATLAVAALIFGALEFFEYVRSQPGERLLEVRATGFQGDPNYFALYQVFALPAALAIGATSSRGFVRAVSVAAVGVIVLSVVASLSRGGLLALAAVVLVTMVVPARALFPAPTAKLRYLAALLVAAALVAASGAGRFVERVETILPGESVAAASSSGRIDLWRAAWHGFKQHPIEGLGAGNFRAEGPALVHSAPGVDARAIYGPLREPRFIHNMYLGPLTELGLVGFTLLMLVLGLTARTLFSVHRRARAARDAMLARFSAAILVSLFGFSVAGFFLSVEFGKPLWIVVGLALALDVMARRGQVRVHKAGRVVRGEAARASA